LNGIFTTVKNQDYLYVGYSLNNESSKQIGTSIKTYTNSYAWTKFLVRLFGLAIEIEINGKKQLVTKQSLKEHLWSIEIKHDNIKEISRIGYEAFVRSQKEVVIPTNRELVDNLSIKKRDSLFKKMIDQLACNNTEAVKKLVQKGAYVDREFYVTCEPLNHQTLWLDQNALYHTVMRTSKENFEFYKHTPLTLAIDQSNETLAQLFFKLKNEQINSDKKETYQYQIESKTKSELTPVFIKGPIYQAVANKRTIWILNTVTGDLYEKNSCSSSFKQLFFKSDEKITSSSIHEFKGQIKLISTETAFQHIDNSLILINK